MKPYLFFSVVTMALTASLPAAAQQQNANTKNSDSLMNDTRRIESAPPRPSQATPEPRYESRTETKTTREASAYDDFTGFYGGGDVGYAFTDDVEGWNGGLFLGYGFEHRFDILGAYAGVELAHEWSNAEGSTGVLSYEKDRAWILSVRPGVTIMGDGLGYGIIGYSRAEFEGAGDDDQLDGLVLGVGSQFNTGTAFKPRVEYTHTNYEAGNLGGTSFEATENVVKVGAVFQF